MSTSAISSDRPGAIPPPVYKPEEYTTAGIVLKFFEEKAKDFAKALGSAVFWTTQAMPALPPAVDSFGKTMGEFKNFISITETPKKTVELHDSLKELWTSVTDLTSKTGSWCKIGTAARKVFKNTAGFVSNLVDGISFSSRFIPIDQATKTTLGGIGFVATAGAAGNGAIEQVEKMAKTDQKDTKRQTLNWINLARDISFLALGVIGAVFFFTAAPVIPWMLAACSTAGLVLSLSSYFYEKVHDPEQKGKNLNPEIVMENTMARKKYEASLVST